MLMSADTRPGIHPGVDLSKFEPSIQRAIKTLAAHFYITNDGFEVSFTKASKYKFVLMKASNEIAESFGVHGEVICLFSLYEKFEARTLDAFDRAYQKYFNNRLEKVCRWIVSGDNDIEQRIKNIVASDPESPVYIPFSLKELSTRIERDYILDRMRKHFFTRDLFAFNSPLKRDLYFFGRMTLVQELIDRAKNGEHSGLFGLRKSGKTSVVYGIERALTITAIRFLLIDCQDPSIHGRRWFELLHWVSREAFTRTGKQGNVRSEESYTERDAAMFFAEDMRSAARGLAKTGRFLICLDEIERISFSTASNAHWKSGKDALLFWQSVRAAAQRFPEAFSLVISGTNPRCVELPHICGDDNPIFQFVKVYYLTGFYLDDTIQMIQSLGRYMGINFSMDVCAKINDDYGGQPFLIRQLCSKIHCNAPRSRPILIRKPSYEASRRDFEQDIDPFMEMIMGVLKEIYPEEVEMLSMLADGKDREFKEFADSDMSLTRHLLGYGILLRDVGHYSFRLEVVRDYLRRVRKHQRMSLSNEERWTEISERRNALEQELRDLVRQQLIAFHGKRAHAALLAAIDERRKPNLQTIGYRDLLHRTSSPLYLDELRCIVSKYWDCFQNIFRAEKPRVEMYLQDINKFRVDAHAKEISVDDFSRLRVSFSVIEDFIREFREG